MSVRVLCLALAIALAGCNGESSETPATSNASANLLGTAPPGNFNAERYCQGALPLTRISVTAREARVMESNERNISSLTFSQASYHKGQVVLGLAETAFQLTMGADLITRVVPDSGDSCSRLGVKVVVSMPFHVVNIAHELKPGTCAYDKVREHEYRHVAVNRDALYNAAAVLQKEMKDFFGQQIFYGDPAKLRKELKVALESHWMPRLQDLKAEGLVGHQSIDSEEEYASNNTDCDGEIPALLQSDEQFDSLLEPAATEAAE